MGIAVNLDGEFRLFTGNEVGTLLLDYILKRRTEKGTLPERPVAVKTIVTSDLTKKIADEYGVELIDVLTGFKFIGEQIGLLEEKGEAERYIFGFEESYGYLAGSYVRDKDAVVASMLICEMTAYYKTLGLTLMDVLLELYKKHGCYVCSQKSFTCEGQSGMQHIKDIMTRLRTGGYRDIDGMTVACMKDYGESVSTDTATGEKTAIDLPSSNVIGFHLADGSSVIVRPSGTEPKIKMYLSAVGVDKEAAEALLARLENAGTALLGF